MKQVHHLNRMLEPRAIAVVGASPNPEAIGHVIMKNLIDGGYRGTLWAVNPKHAEILGRPCVKHVEQINGTENVDLAIATIAPQQLPELVEQCGRAGIRYLVVVSNPGLTGAASPRLMQRLRDTAKKAGVRLLGPKSLGLVRPSLKLNATFTDTEALAGEVALVAQSGAMCAAVIDWATANGVGLSAAVALGSGLDIDFGEVLDYLVHDDRTRYILLHIERVRNARGFMSALRAAARVKPVILLKSGGGGQLAELDNGLTEDQRHEREIVRDAVFDAAVRRAGVVRVHHISQLFYAAKALASGFHPRGSQLAIISNGTGPGAMAADCAAGYGIPLAQPTADSVAALQSFLPFDWTGKMPVDLGGDATPERYLKALGILASDPNVHAVLVVLSPLAMAHPTAVAQGIVEFARKHRTPLCVCLMGGARVAEARLVLDEAGIPAFRTPDTVIELFHNIATYFRNQKLLLQVPASDEAAAGSKMASKAGNARTLVEVVLAERRNRLGAMEARALLRGAGVPVPHTLAAHSATEAMFAAEQLGLPVTLQAGNPATRLAALASPEAVRAAWHELSSLADATDPVIVMPHRPLPHARELAIAVYRDPVFGPVIQFGAGRHQAEVFGDRAVALPPLNGFLARDLIASTRYARTLDNYRDWPPVDRKAVESVLLAVSNLVCELPWIKTLDIDPLLADEAGVLVCDVRVMLDHAVATDRRYGHMAIHPYPVHLEQSWPLADGRIVTVRPVRPEDAVLEQAFVDAMSPESRYFRFMDASRELPPGLIARFTQVDYDREMALVAIVDEGGRPRQIGSARYAEIPDGESVEFALAIDDRWQQFGLGRRLMDALCDIARAQGYRSIVGDVLADNAKMLRLMHALGFSSQVHPDDRALKRVVKALTS